MTARKQPVMLQHKQRKREEARPLLDGCRKVIGPTSAQTERERGAAAALDGRRKVTGSLFTDRGGERDAVAAG
jgi:hypothetical protein